MIKIQSTITKTGDTLSITDESITINGSEHLKDNLYIKTGEEGEVLPPIYLDGEDIVFNHNVDKTRKHVTFVCRLGNDKRFFDKDLNSLIDWDELKDYVDFYNMSDEDQKKLLVSIRDSYLEDKISKGLTLSEAKKEWVEKGK